HQPVSLSRGGPGLFSCVCSSLSLSVSSTGSFVVNVTQTSYQAENSHKITMEWTFTTNPDRSSKTLSIVCCHVQNKHFVLYQVNNGVEVSKSQDKKFSGRVQSDKDALREGRIRLQLSRLRSNDSGLYLCEVKTDHGFGVGRCRLNVIRHKRSMNFILFIYCMFPSAMFVSIMYFCVIFLSSLRSFKSNSSEITKCKYFVTVVKYNFQVSVLYLSIFLTTCYFYPLYFLKQISVLSTPYILKTGWLLLV
uniref:Immunoglobulin domain-containing protein n=1 Tax=Pundamilia nyererei TaxID=303518 RepID=A0A3B4GYV8_9CICH